MALHGLTSAGGLTGSGDKVLALTVYNTQLIAAGRFTNQGNNIASWNGTSWSSLGSGTDERIFTLTVYNSELIAGGRFRLAGGITAYNIAKWNGTTWSNVGIHMPFGKITKSCFNSIQR
jgi:hypothetical protein